MFELLCLQASFRKTGIISSKESINVWTLIPKGENVSSIVFHLLGFATKHCQENQPLGGVILNFCFSSANSFSNQHNRWIWQIRFINSIGFWKKGISIIIILLHICYVFLVFSVCGMSWKLSTLLLLLFLVLFHFSFSSPETSGLTRFG